MTTHKLWIERQSDPSTEFALNVNDGIVEIEPLFRVITYNWNWILHHLLLYALPSFETRVVVSSLALSSFQCLPSHF